VLRERLDVSFSAQEEQLLRRLVDLLRHLSPTRRSIVVSEALQRSTAEDGGSSMPARDAETLQVSRRIAPPAQPPASPDRDPKPDDDR
jgi:hypothetical protein